MNTVTILASEYIPLGHLDYGPIFSSIGFNDVEGTLVDEIVTQLVDDIFNETAVNW